MKLNIYDVVFVLPTVSITYPPGGYDIVYRLAQALNKESIRPSIIFLKKPKIYIENYIVSENVKNKNRLTRLMLSLFNLLFNGKRINLFYKLRLYKLLGVDYNYSILDNIDLYYYETIEDVKIKTNIVIATSWETAYFVREYVKKHKIETLYLVQGSPDDVSVSGKNSDNAKLTYTFPFKKIAINQKVYNRFKAEKPLFFHVGIATQFFKKLTKTNDRECIMFPLRKNESKGSKYAIECIRKLLQNNKNTKIMAFGDYKLDEIPVDIRNSIIYHYWPPRKVLLGLYNKSMIFVLPSIVEGMSLPPLEAMACGCAVVVTDNGGVNEYIKDGLNGIMCPIRDSNCLYQKVILLINNKALREQIIQNGLKTAKEFSYDNMNKNFIRLIKEIR